MTTSKGLLAGMPVNELKARITTPPYTDYWLRLTRRWREVAAFEAETGRIINIGSCAGGQITWLVREAALEGHTAAMEGAAGKSTDFIYTEEEARRERADLTYSNWYRPRLVAEQTGPVGLILAVISPRHADAPPLPVRVVSSHRVFRVEIDCGDFIDTLIAAPDRGLLAFDDIQGYAELALIRRNRNDGVIDYWTAGGETLTFTRDSCL
jgi:hypothetical protein